MACFILVVIAVLVFFIALAALISRAQMSKSSTGSEALQGLIGEVKKDLTPQGKVFVNGELWNAEADENLPAGTKVRVVSVENLKLKVEKIDAR